MDISKANLSSSSNDGGPDWDLGAGIDAPNRRLTLCYDRRKIARVMKLQLAVVSAVGLLLVAALSGLPGRDTTFSMASPANMVLLMMLGALIAVLFMKPRRGTALDLRANGIFVSDPSYGDLSMGWDEIRDVQSTLGFVKLEPVDIGRAGTGGGLYTKLSCSLRQILRQRFIYISTAYLPLNASEVAQQINLRRSFHAQSARVASPAISTSAMPSWVTEQISQQCK